MKADRIKGIALSTHSKIEAGYTGKQLRHALCAALDARPLALIGPVRSMTSDAVSEAAAFQLAENLDAPVDVPALVGA